MITDHDMAIRLVFVVRAKAELIAALKDLLPAAGLRRLLRPSIVMTQELPYELYFESWSRAIIQASKERYVSEELAFGNLSNPAFRLAVDIDTDDLQGSFDRWWHIEEAETYTEIEPTWLGA